MTNGKWSACTARALSSSALVFCTLACSTPPEIKEASKAHLAAIEVLDEATLKLQQSLAAHDNQRLQRAALYARIRVAQEAVEAAADSAAGSMTAAGVFDKSLEDVWPHVYYAFSERELVTKIKWLEKRIDDLDREIQSQPDATKRRALVAEQAMVEADLDDTRLCIAQAGRKPADVRKIESTMQETIDRIVVAGKTTYGSLSLLRAQIALMQKMAQRVDTWLSIDVTPSQDQVDSLTDLAGQVIDTQGGSQE